MESTEKTVGNENGQFHRCVYPYCRNMAIATTDYCELHKHSSLLVKHPRSKNPPSKVAKAVSKNPAIKKMIRSTDKVKRQIRKEYPKVLPQTVTITLTVNEALDTGTALVFADLINADRFKDARKISAKILTAIIKQVSQDELEGAS